jgi:hypothetical protein
MSTRSTIISTQNYQFATIISRKLKNKILYLSYNILLTIKMSTIADQAIFNYITNNPYNKIIKQEILNYVTKNPYPNTHCIIGSAVRNENLNEYIPKIQQILIIGC